MMMTNGIKHLLVKLFTDDTINSAELIKLLKSEEVNKRYINNEPELYAELMESILFEKFKHPFINPNDFIEKMPSGVSDGILFANISFPEEVRVSKKIPTWDTKKFYSCVFDLHNQCHELTKAKLAEKRRIKP